MSRHDNFDANRQLEKETEIEALNERIKQLQDVLVRQESILQQQQLQHQEQNQFLLQPKDIIEQFRRIKSLDGNHNPMAFIKSVESTFNLCRHNEHLQQYGLQIIINEKIIGDVARIVGELENLTWNEIKSKIIQRLQPRKTYAEVFNYCRYVKVSNLEELFSVFEKSKCELNEIYAFDPLKPTIYKPENIDRDLVDIMIGKIDGTIRAHINSNETMQDIIMKYTRLRLLRDKRTIDYRHKKENKIINNSNNRYTQINKQSQLNTNANYNTNLVTQNTNKNQTKQNYFQTNHYRGDNKTNQTRVSRMSFDTRNTRLEPEPMDIGTIDEIQINEEKEINFLTLPQNPHYP